MAHFLPNHLKQFLLAMVLITIPPIVLANQPLPSNFVYLSYIDPTIIQEIRYAGSHNFVGRPIKGYYANSCILTLPAAKALKKVQTELKTKGYSLKVYDCYRPQMATHDFLEWSKTPQANEMQNEFYPRVSKQNIFPLGYVADYSGHSRGSTVDLTIVNLKNLNQQTYRPGQPLIACYESYPKRFLDNSIDMGTGFDCLDVLAHVKNKDISSVALQNRQLLQNLMIKYGFQPLEMEWWHFTLKNEPFPHHYFNFPVK